jgi:hypothetical protein
MLEYDRVSVVGEVDDCFAGVDKDFLFLLGIIKGETSSGERTDFEMKEGESGRHERSVSDTCGRKGDDVNVLVAPNKSTGDDAWGG